MSKKATKGTPAGAKKAKRRAAGAGGRDGAVTMSVATHPRARAHVRQAKGWGGLGAFAVTAYLSLSHGVAADAAGLRALAAGAGGYVVAWGASVMVWRQLMIAELRARAERARRQWEAEAAAHEAEQAASS